MASSWDRPDYGSCASRRTHAMCQSAMNLLTTRCNTEYSFSNEDEGDYGIGWAPLNYSRVPAPKPHSDYTYNTALDLFGAPFWGEMYWYWGGGYVALLGYSRADIVDKLAELSANNWIDQLTRAVFLEFNLYYPASNLFVVAEALFEFPAQGESQTCRVRALQGIISSLIVFPINLALVMIFKLARERSPKAIREKDKATRKAWKAQQKASIAKSALSRAASMDRDHGPFILV
ncbi:PREDICTED: polycystic kidney disease protein 1-like 2 [Priapulus caudatus]|uniref:Polycystic kidney disease protein 1-like 2 n=1 Tax=Priapulus caudatus TaxID=37621 RepID=A0ABM1DUL2_PRICU|nr:PREDICTED: polycystic kidney disease protein 1-like 2 [Priapulus caudatus]